MIQSMTGFGRGEAARGGKRLIVQVSSVNHRHCDLRFTMARELCHLEKPLRDAVRACVQRGSLQIVVELINDHSVPGQVQANMDLARDYVREARRLCVELGITGDLKLQDLLQVPGIFQVDEPETATETLVSMAAEAMQQALEALVGMREREGDALLRDLRERLDLVESHVQAIGERAPAVPREYREKLKARIEEILDEPGVDQDRLMKEVAWFADKADIAEEVTRLGSHAVQMRELLGESNGDALGRKLDFLLQEMHREVNTIGSKANDQAIARHVVELKAELERMREQAQNIQ